MTGLHPTLSDRILAAIAWEPHSEDDLVLAFPRMSRDAIRVKVADLVRTGKIRADAGVYRLAAGVTVSDGVSVNVVSAPPEDEAAKPRIAHPKAADGTIDAPRAVQTCKVCAREKPLDQFGRSAPNGAPRRTCLECHGAAIKAGQRAKREQRAPAPPEPAPAVPAAPAAVEVPTGSFALESVTDVERAVDVRRTTMITLADHAGVIRTLTLDDEGVDALLAALRTARASREAA